MTCVHQIKHYNAPIVPSHYLKYTKKGLQEIIKESDSKLNVDIIELAIIVSNCNSIVGGITTYLAIRTLETSTTRL